MGDVAIVTDSTCYLPDELCELNEVRRVSLYVNWSSRSVREMDISDYAAFYEELRSAEELPTTSQPPIGDFIQVYEPLLESGRDIVSIHISGGISGTVDSARQAAAQLEDAGTEIGRVTVIDATTAGGGLGLLVLAAARAAAVGRDAAAVHQAVHEARAELKLWLAVDTLEFLRRGGRIGGAAAWIGSTLKIKPIITIENEIKPVERVRTRARVFERMLDFARERKESGADAWAVQHVQVVDQANELAEAITEVMGCQPQFVSEVGPVIGVHVGPGVLGFAAVPAYLLQ